MVIKGKAAVVTPMRQSIFFYQILDFAYIVGMTFLQSHECTTN